MRKARLIDGFRPRTIKEEPVAVECSINNRVNSRITDIEEMDFSIPYPQRETDYLDLGIDIAGFVLFVSLMGWSFLKATGIV